MEQVHTYKGNKMKSKLIYALAIVGTLLIAGCEQAGLSKYEAAALDATLANASYVGIKQEGGGGVVVPVNSKHKREDCPNNGWITQGDGHRSRCPDCDPPYSSDVDQLTEQVDLLKAQLEQATAAAAKAADEAKLANAAADEAIKAAQAQIPAEQPPKVEVAPAKTDEELEAEIAKIVDAKIAAIIAKNKEAKAKAAAELAAKQKAEQEAKDAWEKQQAYQRAASSEPNEEVKSDPHEKCCGPNCRCAEGACTCKDGECLKQARARPAFDASISWQLPPAERAKVFQEEKLSWKTANGKCCPDCKCAQCFCMYPGQCLVEANGRKPVSIYKTDYVSTYQAGSCSGGGCSAGRWVQTPVTKVVRTYQQPKGEVVNAFEPTK